MEMRVLFVGGPYMRKYCYFQLSEFTGPFFAVLKILATLMKYPTFEGVFYICIGKEVQN